MFHVGLLINVFSLLCAIFALWKGGIAERYVALVVVANVVIGQSAQWIAPNSGEFNHLIIDGLTALILMGITLRYTALWMGGVMLFFAAQFSLHSYYLVTERPIDYLYALINNIDFLGIIWSLIIGTIVAWRRRARAVPSPS